MAIEIGQKAPQFELPGVDDKTHSLAQVKGPQGTIVVFSCNHCPYVVMYEERMVKLHRDYAPRGITMVAINANDTEAYPADNLENMKLRAASRGFEFPYLIDESQESARLYGATRTPEVFLLDESGTVVYHGRIDDNAEDAGAVERHDLREALEQLLAGSPIAVPDTTPIGCGIKWRLGGCGSGCATKGCADRKCNSEK